MAIVQLTISALPAHVRTARLMATAVARRAGIAESALDEVRLAVGEACSRAVEAHRAHCPDQPIRLELIDSAGSGPSASADAARRGSTLPGHVNGSGSRRFEVVVSDRAPAKEPVADSEPDSYVSGGLGSYLGVHTPPGGISGLSPDVGLAVIVGLADEVSIEPNEDGTVVRMSWPLGADDTAPANPRTAG
ncbi:anti-sigma regulatory factor (Ser/Thr protein kinase) [Spinactinospora alkalitolerans]|uniref:Anti-sigma regulatory factor (Ser/Thr protein kinase) n=1 Tax=Spinactinospora alkalitolerans TaxID=687207 RepID=A0A852U5L9_9ACTN|nr:ATP-binding protein [Spinactinospora alkalitolerans]NYE50917.1 anti-sigma regulatory factor (Ser/Thr protein kinase) [Spinactinospora alkalitolerans]